MIALAVVCLGQLMVIGFLVSKLLEKANDDGGQLVELSKSAFTSLRAVSAEDGARAKAIEAQSDMDRKILQNELAKMAEQYKDTPVPEDTSSEVLVVHDKAAGRTRRLVPFTPENF